MNQICRDIFRAIHEGKWLKIEYRNKADQITKYWIGIRDLDPAKRTLKVDGRCIPLDISCRSRCGRVVRRRISGLRSEGIY